MIGLGDKAKDMISGYTGIVVAVTQWLHGCRRLTLQTQGLDKDGKPIECQSFDWSQVELVESTPQPVPVVETGGPRPEPRRF
jgi:hypothetical protein